MHRSLITLASVGFLALASCQDQESLGSDTSGSSLAEPPPKPSAAVIAALGKQPFGSKLLGRTHYLVGDRYVGADMQKAPEYYLLNFSGSF